MFRITIKRLYVYSENEGENVRRECVKRERERERESRENFEWIEIYGGDRDR